MGIISDGSFKILEEEIFKTLDSIYKERTRGKPLSAHKSKLDELNLALDGEENVEGDRNAKNK